MFAPLMSPSMRKGRPPTRCTSRAPSRSRGQSGLIVERGIASQSDAAQKLGSGGDDDRRQTRPAPMPWAMLHEALPTASLGVLGTAGMLPFPTVVERDTVDPGAILDVLASVRAGNPIR